MKTQHSSLLLERIRKNRLAHAISTALATLFTLKVAEAEDSVVILEPEGQKHPSAASLDLASQPKSSQRAADPLPYRLDIQTDDIFLEGGTDIGTLDAAGASYGPNSDTRASMVGIYLNGESRAILAGNPDTSVQLSTTHPGGKGILVVNGADLTVRNATIHSAGVDNGVNDRAAAVLSIGAGSKLAIADSTITGSQGYSAGVSALQGGAIVLSNTTIASSMDAEVSGEGSYLEFRDGSEVDNVLVSQQGEVLVDNSTVHGTMFVTGGGRADITDSIFDGTQQKGSAPLQINNDFSEHQAVVNVTGSTLNQVPGNRQQVVEITGGADVSIRDSAINGVGNGIASIRSMMPDAGTRQNITLDNVDITVHDDTSGQHTPRGIVLSGGYGDEDSGQTNVHLSNSRINVSGLTNPEYEEQAAGIDVYGDGVSIRMENSHIKATIEGDAPAYGVEFHNGAGSSAFISQESVVQGKTNGVYATSGNAQNADLIVDASTIIGEQGSAISVTDLAAMNVEVRNGGKLQGGNGTIVEVTNQGQVDLNINGSQLTGNIVSDNETADRQYGYEWNEDTGTGDYLTSPFKSTVNVQMQNNASLTGIGTNIDTMRIDPTSQWTMTGDSNVGQLDNQGWVAFEAGDGYKTLTVEGDLDGSGTFAMNTDIAERQGDQLVVQGTASGTHQLAIEDSGKQPEHLDALKVVDTNGGSARFDLMGGHVDAGAYRYNLKQSADDWYLTYQDLVPTDPIDPIDPTDPDDQDDPTPPVNPVLPDPRPQDLSKGANAALGMQSATSQLFNAEMDSLNQRLGDVRGEKGEGGVWVRGLGKRLEVDSGKSREFDQSIKGVQVGADKAIPLSNGKVLVGGMVGASQADMDFGEGAKGKVDATSVGAYGTYLHEDGWYVDGVAKLQNFDADVKMPNNLGHSVKGDYSGKGVGVSVEAGKHIKLENNWFVEPQVQLSASRVDGPDYTSSDDMKVDGDAMDSLQGRVGARFGKFIPLDQGRSLQPFVKINQIHEFKGNADVKVNDVVTLDNALPGSRTEIGVGAQLNLGEKHKVYLEAEAAKGDDVEQPFGVNIGYRYDW